jgi:hypothetical protein
MFYIGTPCPACFAGAVGFRRCSNEQSIVLMCNECDAVWLQPSEVTLESAFFPTAPEYAVPSLDCSLASPAADWAKRDEIKSVGWEGFIAGEGEA